MPAPAPSPAPALNLWQNTWRILVAALVGLVLWLTTAANAGAGNTASSWRPSIWVFVDPAIGLVALVLLGFRRRWPVAVALTTTAATAVSASAAGPSLFAVISLSTRRRWRELALVVPLWIGTGFVLERIYPSTQDQLPWWVLVVIGVLTCGISVAIGFYIGARRELVASLRERAETAEREQQRRVAQARATERARIAREMHDVLAHRISLVAMHAGAMTYRTDLTRDELAGAAKIVQDNAHRALTDLRDVLGVLRTTPDPDHPERPQPTLRDLSELLDEAGVAGTRVDLQQGLHDPDAVPQTTARTAYRIIQEALTNARKHAPGAAVQVSLGGRAGGRLCVEVRNRLPLQPPADGAAVPGSGLGLLGLIERAALSGGELTHGPTAGQEYVGQEYVVRAWLPWPA